MYELRGPFFAEGDRVISRYNEDFQGTIVQGNYIHTTHYQGVPFDSHECVVVAWDEDPTDEIRIRPRELRRLEVEK